jgi:hypothetical protein
LLYPPTLLVQVFSLPHALTVYAAVHYLWTGYWMWRLLRAWGVDQLPGLFGALVWMASGYLVSIHLNFNYLVPAAWYPVVLFCYHHLLRRRTLLGLMATGLAWAMVLLGGDPQAFLFAGVLMLLSGSLAFGAWLTAAAQPVPARKRVALLALTGLVTTLLVLAQFLPSLEFIAACTRGQGMNFLEAATWSHHPLRLLEWIWPELWGPSFPGEQFFGQFIDPKTGMPWVGVVSLGLFPLLLALGQFRRSNRPPVRFLALTALLFLLLALGYYSPLYRLVWSLVPLYRIFRFPEKHLAVATFALAGLAAFGFQNLLAPESGPARRAFGQRWAVLTALLALAFAVLLPAASTLAQALAAYDLRAFHVAREPSLIRASLLNAALRALLVAGLYLLLWALLQRANPLRSRLGPVLLLATAADLLSLGRAQVHATDPSLFTSSPAASRIIHDDQKDPAEPFRFYRSNRVSRPSEFFEPAGTSLSEQAIYWNRATLNRNQGVPEGLEDLFGYDPAKFTSYYLFRSQPLSIETLRLLNVKYLLDGVNEKEVPDSLHLPLVAELPRLNLRVLRNQGYFPRAFWVDGVRAAPDESRFLDLLNSTNLRRNVILLRPPSGTQTGTSFQPARIESYHPQQTAVLVNNPLPGHLVLSDTYFPGWQATVDGRPVRILRANYLIRAVPLAPGAHRVVFTYRPWPWRIGASASLVSLLLVPMVLLLRRR